jgi:hypothetical protein
VPSISGGIFQSRATGEAGLTRTSCPVLMVASCEAESPYAADWAWASRIAPRHIIVAAHHCNTKKHV